MTFTALFERLERAGFELDADQVLDALWLASQHRKLGLHASDRRPDRPHADDAIIDGDDTPDTRDAPDLSPKDKPARQPQATERRAGGSGPGRGETGQRSIFPRIEAASGDTVNASLVAIPAPMALANRLKMMRALRPLNQRWLARQFAELDEELTVDMSAALSHAEHSMVMPMFKPRRERWYDVELVLEDDAAISLWQETLREFAQMLRDTGAFGRVREWRLRLPDAKEKRAELDNTLGARAPVASLLGKAARRLVVFASTGISPRWSDGTYAAILAPWIKDNSVALLHLTRPEQRARTRLGESQGIASTTQPGCVSWSLDYTPFWWRMPDDLPADSVLLPLPVIELTAQSLMTWADMQMARGRANPIYLIEQPGARHNEAPDSKEETPRRTPSTFDARRTIDLLKYEAPEAFRLGVLLSTSPFTLDVARLIQAIEFNGDTDPHRLSELIRCGLVREATHAAPDRHSTLAYYAVREEAKPELFKSMHGRDAARVVSRMRERISERLPELAAGGGRSAQLIVDDEGREKLPAWARPFADVSSAMLGLAGDLDEAQEQLQALADAFPDAVVRAIADLARRNAPVVPSAFGRSVWQYLVASKIVFERHDGVWLFAPRTKRVLAAYERPAFLTDDDLDWIETAITVLQSMALAFHVGGICNPRRTGFDMRSALREWPDAPGAINYWFFMSEWVFATPVRTLLMSGVDPLRHSDATRSREAFDKSLDAWRSGSGTFERTYSYTEGINQLMGAIGMLALREPERFAELASPTVAELMAGYDGTPIDDATVDAPEWFARETELLEWLGADDVVTAVAHYCGDIYQYLHYRDFEALGRPAHYIAYIESLLDLWKRATTLVFERVPDDAPIEMTYGVPEDEIARIQSRYPQVSIGVSSASTSSTEGNTEWIISRDGYLALIDELGPIVTRAIAYSLARGHRRADAMWVDANHEVSAYLRGGRLADSGIRFTMAMAAYEGTERARGQLFDVVIADVDLAPDSVGAYQMLEVLRKTGNQVPFIFYAGGRNVQQIDRSMREHVRGLGAIGTTGDWNTLVKWIMRALLSHDRVLDRPVDVHSLLQYTRWKFPGEPVSEAWNTEAVKDLNTSTYATLLDIDAAVERAWAAVFAYAEARPDAFSTGTDYVTIALGFCDDEFRRRHNFDHWTLDAFERYASLVLGAPSEESVSMPAA